MANRAKWNEVEFGVGDVVGVYQKLIEGKGKETKERIQVFEGMVISIRGRGDSKTFTVRKVGADGVGVERIWPLNSVWIKKIEVKSKAKRVRRAKLYYTREKSRKELRKIQQR